MTATTEIPDADERVLSTMNPDGSRRWLRPKVSTGRFLQRRRVVGWALIAIFTLLPWLRIAGKPLILLDIAAREFTLFGTTFLPTDTLLLALLMLSILVAIFLATALLGRIWCGWACPQTVYMELLYRPIERLFEGPAYRSRGKAEIAAWRRPAKYVTFLLVSVVLAHTFLAYFVGTDRLLRWMTQSPFEHPTGFLMVAAMTFLMMLDFCVLREQICTLMCPYGRFQSVMLDRQSLIISYDTKRGEPRGRLSKKTGKTEQGDCIDCKLCYTTCPTGIDIREGLQMECVGCAQCIDACDTVMDQIGTPRGLIRYTSQEAMEVGRQRLLRGRVIVYPLILVGLLTALGFALAGRSTVDVWFQRIRNTPYALSEDGRTVTVQVLMRLANRTREIQRYDVGLLTAGGTCRSNDTPLELAASENGSVTLWLELQRSIFNRGRAEVAFSVTDGAGSVTEVKHYVPGPLFAPKPDDQTRAGADS